MSVAPTLRILDRIDRVTPEAWDALLDPDDPPVLSWYWLEALEHTGTAGPRRGWRPNHLALFREGALVAACPLWLRDDPDGEFVWYEPVAAFCREAGFDWAPRGVSTVPATPVAGRRLLTHPSVDRAAGLEWLIDALGAVLLGQPLASLALHFCADDEAAALAARGWIERRQWQYWWRSAGEQDFEGFLGRLKSKMRRQIQRERRLLRARGVEPRMVPGGEAPLAWFDTASELYGLTAERYDVGEQLIAPGFFPRIGRSPLRDTVRFSVGLEGDAVVGLAFELQGRDALFGRTWGLRHPVEFLHFECAYYQSVEYAIAQGLSRFEPGHGGEFKHRRGFEPTLVRTMHAYREPRLHAAVGGWARRESAWVDEQIAERRETGTLRVFGDGV